MFSDKVSLWQDIYKNDFFTQHWNEFVYAEENVEYFIFNFNPKIVIIFFCRQRKIKAYAKVSFPFYEAQQPNVR